MTTPDVNDEQKTVLKQLGLWDAISIIVGIVIGAGIFETAPLILQNVSGPWMALGVWALGGALSLVGALCYAELATTYPREGGDIVYLTRAYGKWVGFLFGWAQLTVILTASIGAMAYVFGDYAVKLWGQKPEAACGYAVLAVLVLSVLNILGVIFGKGTQNLLTVAKVLGLGGILVAGFSWGNQEAFTLAAAGGTTSFGLAMILVLYTYGGWNDAAFVAAEVRDPKRNIPRALILGTCLITLIYLLVNTAYILALGFQGAASSEAIAADVLKLPLGEKGSQAMSLLVMISALGAVNGLIFTGARVFFKLGSEHRIFGWLGHWHPRLGIPLWALVAQALITLVMIVVVGTDQGRDAVNQVLTWLGVKQVSWWGHGGFETLVISTAPVFWLFFLLTGLSLFVLREKDRDIQRPFSVPLYPVVPLIFCNMCIYMLYSATKFAVEQFGAFGLIGWVALLLGVLLYVISRPASSDAASSD